MKNIREWSTTKKGKQFNKFQDRIVCKKKNFTKKKEKKKKIVKNERQLEGNSHHDYHLSAMRDKISRFPFENRVLISRWCHLQGESQFSQ